MGLDCSNASNPCCSNNESDLRKAEEKRSGLPKGFTTTQNEEGKKAYIDYRKQTYAFETRQDTLSARSN